jgi:hypothetical protein
MADGMNNWLNQLQRVNSQQAILTGRPPDPTVLKSMYDSYLQGVTREEAANKAEAERKREFYANRALDKQRIAYNQENFNRKMQFDQSEFQRAVDLYNSQQRAQAIGAGINLAGSYLLSRAYGNDYLKNLYSYFME